MNDKKRERDNKERKCKWWRCKYKKIKIKEAERGSIRQESDCNFKYS